MLPDILKRIVSAKYILERAAKMQDESGEMGTALSLLLMHDSVEMLMHAVVDHLQLKKKFEFMSFWTVIKESGRPEPPDHTPMDSLNKLRVNLKHHANLPNPRTVRDLLPRVRGFFENVLTAYCSVDYASVSLVDLVPDQGIRSMLHEAEGKFASGDKSGALISLRVTLHEIEKPKGKVLPALHAPPKPRLPSEMARGGWDQYLNQLHSFMDQCASWVNSAMLGVDPVRYAMFVRSTPTLQWSVSGKYTAIMTRSYDNASQSEFSDLVNFLIEYAVKANDAYIPVVTTPVKEQEPA